MITSLGGVVQENQQCSKIRIAGERHPWEGNSLAKKKKPLNKSRGNEEQKDKRKINVGS